MRNDKQRAMRLRLKGRSYNEINRLLGTPKSTLSGWFSDLELPKEAKKRLSERVYKKSIEKLIKRNKLQSHEASKRARGIRSTAKGEVEDISSKELMFAGISLYWAEGYKRPIVVNGKTKTHHPVSLTNSDPKLIKIYLRFIREICGVPEEKIRADVRIYEHQDEAHLLEFWSQTTNIPYDRFKSFQIEVRNADDLS